MLDRKLSCALALWAFVLALTDVAAQIQPNTWLFRDGRFYVNVNENLLMNGSLEDPFAASWYNGDLAWNYDLSADFSNVALGARGEHYHFRPWLLPVLSTPLYFALGLLGVLVFNLLTYCVIAAGTYRFARAYAPADVSALAALVMVFASGFRHHAYNYSVDLLLVACFSAALAMLVERKGVLAGVLVAAGVMIKPTTLLYAPALALVLWERRDLPTLKRSIAGGSGMLAFYGCVNTYMYGRPWWTGYNRAVVTVHGEPGIFDDATNFETPFWAGATELFSGADGLLWWHGVFVLALPGLLVLAARAPRTALAIFGSFAGAFYVFSKFQYHHDRFMFPAVELLAVPIALGLLALALFLHRHLRLARAPAAALVLAATAAGMYLVTSPSTLHDRVLDSGAVEGAMLVAEGTLDMREATSDVDVRPFGAGSDVSLAGERWAPRAAPAALAVLAPLAAIGGRGLVVAASILAAAIAIFAAARLLARSLPAPLAGAISVAAVLVGPGRETAIGDPSSSLAAASLLLALAIAAEAGPSLGRWAAVGALAMAGASFASAPLAAPVVLAAALFLAWRVGPAAMKRVLVGAGVALGVHLVLATIVLGHPLALPSSSVVVDGSGAAAAVPAPSALEALELALGHGPSASRAVVPLLLFLFPGLLLARPMGLRVALAALVALLAVPGLAMAHERTTLLAALALVLPAGVVVWAIAERAIRWAKAIGSAPALGSVIGAALVLCLALGLVRRAVASERPLWIGTPASVRAAEVHLGDVPCDFLAWENMAWECSYYDGGALGRVGLALPDGPTIDGRPVRNALLVPSGERSHEPRRVTWHDVPVGSRFLLLAGVPDGFDPDVELVVRADGAEIGRFVVRREARGLVEHAFDTSSLEGTVDLEIEMQPVGRSRRGAALVAGGFVGGHGERHGEGAER